MPSQPFRKIAPLALVTLLASACSSSGNGPGASDGNGGGGDEVPGGGGGDNTAAAQVCDIPKDGWARAPMRRLTIVEYDNATEDLLGEKRHLGASAFSADETVSGFAANSAVTVSVAEAEKLATAARQIAEGAAGRLGDVIKCGSGQADEACALAFISRFGRLAFRRPLTDEETGLLSQLYKDKVKTTDHTQGVRLVIEAFLQMPQFLYRPAIGSETPQSGVNKLSGEELASRLSFFLWSSIPDDELLTAAKNGGLDSAEGIKTQADRMMKDGRFDRTLQSFAVQWLELSEVPEKDEVAFPGFGPEIWTSNQMGVAKFFSHVVKDTDGKLETLFTEPVVFTDSKLAKTYGMTVSSTGFEKMPTNPKQRGGIIMQAALLAKLAGTIDSSPVKRGVFVRSRLLCQPPPPPPMNVAPFPERLPTQTVRQQLEQHRSNPTCAACHAFFDPLGLAFEHFDGVGAYRDKDRGMAVDASGELTETDVDGKFADSTELMNLLKGSQTAAECLTTQFYRFAVGRLESDADTCVLKRLTSSLKDGGYSVRDMFSKMATSDAFRFVGRN
jgi:hypothetical protein